MRLPPSFLRRRWQFIGLYWAVQAITAYFFSLVLTWMVFLDDLDTLMGWLAPFGFTAVIIVLQALFLLPIRKPAVAGSWPILASLVVGGLMIGSLAVGFLISVAHLVVEYADVAVDRPVLSALGALAGCWVISTALLLAFCRRGRREQIVQRLAAGIFLGTIFEAAAIIPLDVLVRRREDCICATGTFMGLVTCGSVGVLVFGPAVLLPLVMRHRKRWYGRRCDACGYDMTGNPGAVRCPECGAGWRAG